jgi:hypothetical protein
MLLRLLLAIPCLGSCMVASVWAEDAPSPKAELTPTMCKKALLEMMRSKPGQDLALFDKQLVDEMEKLDVEKLREEYQWTGAYRFQSNKATYVLFVSLVDDRPPLKLHPKGHLIHLRVFHGSFEMKDGRWVATIPKYQYTLLD